MTTITNDHELIHYGIKGMHWGHHKSKPIDTSFAKESSKKIIHNKDGSKTIPPGFMFNRVGKGSIDVNASGALYVSHGKEDAARYVKELGPSVIGRLLGTASTDVQHISVKSKLNVPSDEEINKHISKTLLSDNKLFDTFNKSIYSMVITNDFNDVSRDYIEKAFANPSSKQAYKLAYSVSSFFGDQSYKHETKQFYDAFRKSGYDAIPDTHDILSGTSSTAMIVINPHKVELASTTLITKDVFKSGKAYVKTLNKLKVSDIIS